MSQEFLSVLDYMEKEKGIDRQEMILAIESALLSAARKSFAGAEDLNVELDAKTGQIKAHAAFKVVDKVINKNAEIALIKARAIKVNAKIGDFVETEIPTKDLGRIAAQVFKQTINQNIRSIEKTMIFDEFKDRVGDIITGTVRRFERQNVIIDLGKFEAVMPSNERVPTEDYTPGDRIRGLVLSVDSTPRGPEIVISRSHPKFVHKLFELEVSELHDNTVEIKALAREPGYRTKLAVWSKDEKIDPVGACVGLRGARVKNIVRELNNEKIDLFRWSENIRELAIEALKPAKLKDIVTDEEKKTVTIFVDDENLSLAIGRRGQNARLTAKLTGWNIDINKEEIEVEGFEDKLNRAAQTLGKHLKIDEELAKTVIKAGFGSLEGICEVSVEDLQEGLPDVSEETLEEIKKNAHQALQAQRAL
ncbi:MAG: transcription termination factor NusA [Verrucomicrobiota bacterium]